jgi:hypothetical protein
MSVGGQSRLFGSLKTSSALPFRADLDGSSTIGRFTGIFGFQSLICPFVGRVAELSAASSPLTQFLP